MTHQSPVLSAFDMARPRGVDRPSADRKTPGKTTSPALDAPMHFLDANGRLRSMHGSRAHAGFVIESRLQAQASRDKRNALVKDGR